MGTRCLTKVYDHDGKELLCLYRQFDGYPDGHGAELREFLSGMVVTNGLREDLGKTANGAKCLAAQIVAHFKEAPGGFYIYPAGSKDVGEEYVYHVRVNNDAVDITTEET